MKSKYRAVFLTRIITVNILFPGTFFGGDARLTPETLTVTLKTDNALEDFWHDAKAHPCRI